MPASRPDTSVMVSVLPFLYMKGLFPRILYRMRYPVMASSPTVGSGASQDTLMAPSFSTGSTPTSLGVGATAKAGMWRSQA